MGPCLDRRGRIPQALRNHQALGERQTSRMSGRIPAVIVKPSYAHFLILSVGRLPLFGRLSLGVEKNLFNGSPVSGSFANGFPKPGARHRILSRTSLAKSSSKVVSLPWLRMTISTFSASQMAKTRSAPNRNSRSLWVLPRHCADDGSQEPFQALLVSVHPGAGAGDNLERPALPRLKSFQHLLLPSHLLLPVVAGNAGVGHRAAVCGIHARNRSGGSFAKS